MWFKCGQENQIQALLESRTLDLDQVDLLLSLIVDDSGQLRDSRLAAQKRVLEEMRFLYSS